MLCVRPTSQALLPPLTAEAPPEETAVVRTQRLGLSEGPTRLSSQMAFPEGSFWSASDVGQYSLPFWPFYINRLHIEINHLRGKGNERNWNSNKHASYKQTLTTKVNKKRL